MFLVRQPVTRKSLSEVAASPKAVELPNPMEVADVDPVHVVEYRVVFSLQSSESIRTSSVP